MHTVLDFLICHRGDLLSVEKENEIYKEEDLDLKKEQSNSLNPPR